LYPESEEDLQKRIERASGKFKDLFETQEEENTCVVHIVVCHPEFIAPFSNFYREEKKADVCGLCAVSAVRFETGMDPHPLVHASSNHLKVQKFMEAAVALCESAPENDFNPEEEMMIAKTD